MEGEEYLRALLYSIIIWTARRREDKSKKGGMLRSFGAVSSIVHSRFAAKAQSKEIGGKVHLDASLRQMLRTARSIRSRMRIQRWIYFSDIPIHAPVLSCFHVSGKSSILFIFLFPFCISHPDLSFLFHDVLNMRVFLLVCIMRFEAVKFEVVVGERNVLRS